MNKETIYIESSDDITDILSRLKASDKKVVALVPPKRSTVLLSSVNIKLIARTARSEKKAVVLVTSDDSLIKLAMAANLPVASSLKSRPVMPSDSAEEPEAKTKTVEASAKEKTSPVAPKEPVKEPVDEPSDEILEDASAAVDDSPEEKEKTSPEKTDEPKEKKKKSSGSPLVAFLNIHKNWVIFGTIAVAALIVFFVWALKIAPGLSLTVSVRTTSGNFSENVSFVSAPADEDAKRGVFYANEEKLEKDQTIKFTATGQKDIGEQASGNIVVYFQSKNAFSYSLPEGSVFTYKGLEYVSLKSATLYWDEKNPEPCEKRGDEDALTRGCLVSATISVKASAPGENYNVSGQQSGWASRDFSAVNVYNSTDISGGTSKIVTVVQQSDVDLALDKLANETKENGKTELIGKLSETVLPIDSSFKVSTTEPKTSPAVGEEVPEGTVPSVSSKATYSILTVDMVRIEDFIKEKADQEDGKKLYSVGSPFIEYFVENGEGKYSGKLKTTYRSGPEISENEVLDKIQGLKIGRIEPTLKDSFKGISSVKLSKTVFWVNSVPKNPNQVSISIEIEE
ncbi:hypothetical protein IJH27_01525 [Candidatus Saccharibacteria bacterium]|nr:hypothetical protein [Candidatus Saccharibacteria bacterium]